MTNNLAGDFEAGRVDLASFHHREHLLAALELLRVTDFLSAAVRYFRALQRIADAAGHPGKVNLTVTIAYLSEIAERLAATPELSDEDFLNVYPELLSPQLLARTYSHERLWSPLGRRTFLMPRDLEQEKTQHGR